MNQALECLRVVLLLLDMYEVQCGGYDIWYGAYVSYTFAVECNSKLLASMALEHFPNNADGHTHIAEKKTRAQIM